VYYFQSLIEYVIVGIWMTCSINRSPCERFAYV